MIVLDTNVISELAKPAAEPRVVAWADAQAPAALYATTVSEAEMLYGLALLPSGRRPAGRVPAFDRPAAAAFGGWAAQRRREGRPTAMADLQIAAIARAPGAAFIATRNTRDFGGCGVPLVDPWTTA